jgi:hypothetical protein
MQRHYSGAAEALLAVVEHDVLARRRAAHGLLEAHVEPPGRDLHAAAHVGLAVADLGRARETGRGRRARDPVRRLRIETRAMERGMRASLHDDERVAREVLRRHVPGRLAAPSQASDAEAAALTERIALESCMTTDNLAILGLDRAGPAGQPAPDEFAERPLADEADAGRVRLARDRQPAVAGDCAHLGLGETADREHAGLELCRIELVQEVALVLAGVDPAQQASAGPNARVMAGREALRPEPPRVFEADAELDLAIAEHVRVGRAAGREVREKA